MTPERFRLQPHESASLLWQSLERHMNERLAQLRAQNDAHLPAERTADIRGRIAQLKELMSLAKPPREPET